MKLLLQKVNQGDNSSVYAGRIRVGDLIRQYKIDYYDKEQNPEGYQRNPDSLRYKNFANYIKGQVNSGKSVMIPTSILISSRKKLNLKPEPDGQLVSAVFGPDDFLYVVDGQHRTEGFKYALTVLGLTQVEDFELPFVLIECMQRRDEIEQFLSINTTMKKVKVDLANQLIINLDGKVPDKQKHAILATKISNLLAEGVYPSPWRGKLKPANSIGAKAKGIVYWNTVLSFHNSLKPIVGAQVISGLNEERVAEQLGKFWSAVAELMPEAFSSSYKKYLITKNNGFVSLHRVFLPVYSYLRYNKEVKNPQVGDYRAVLASAADGALNSEFWIRGGEGAAQFGGGFSGFSRLAEQIIDDLKAGGIKF